MTKRGRPGKFTPAQVCDIRTQYNRGKSLTELGRQYGVTHAAIYYIVKGKTYSEVVCK